ncbi:hypothetical protein FE392_14445 [Xenorhabdus sp. 12]|uniref:Uncharacterized protein n=1 Tax=Xenorhabdus santafensis TaxID=2582833 RepID=A0ABU4SCI8_9GAMM|nr:hypothetical protein [Xenorhabdus sp. 12]MDX7988517.1 hypothetical protein [Xenorhabdus sp. 12]
MMKDLILGKFSLAKTFWVFGFLGSVVLSLFGIVAAKSNFYFFCVVLLLRFLLSLMVLSGITFTLRNKITFFGIVAWGIFLIITLVLMVFNIQFVILLIKLFNLNI